VTRSSGAGKKVRKATTRRHELKSRSTDLQHAKEILQIGILIHASQLFIIRIKLAGTAVSMFLVTIPRSGRLKILDTYTTHSCSVLHCVAVTVLQGGKTAFPTQFQATHEFLQYTFAVCCCVLLCDAGWEHTFPMGTHFSQLSISHPMCCSALRGWDYCCCSVLQGAKTIFRIHYQPHTHTHTHTHTRTHTHTVFPTHYLQSEL